MTKSNGGIFFVNISVRCVCSLHRWSVIAREDGEKKLKGRRILLAITVVSNKLVILNALRANSIRPERLRMVFLFIFILKTRKFDLVRSECKNIEKILQRATNAEIVDEPLTEIYCSVLVLLYLLTNALVVSKSRNRTHRGRAK